MLNKKKLRKVFTKICKSCNNKFDCVIDAYDSFLERKAVEVGVPIGSDAYLDFFAGEDEDAIPWLVEGLVNNDVVDYINDNMQYVPVVEFPYDGALSELNDGIKDIIEFFNCEHGEDCHYIMPNIFDLKACRVGSTGSKSFGTCGGFDYFIGNYVTYILSDGSFAVIEEKVFSYDDDEDCVIRRLVPGGCPLLNELDHLLDEDYKDVFGVCCE